MYNQLKLLMKAEIQSRFVRAANRAQGKLIDLCFDSYLGRTKILLHKVRNLNQLESIHHSMKVDTPGPKTWDHRYEKSVKTV